MEAGQLSAAAALPERNTGLGRSLATPVLWHTLALLDVHCLFQSPFTPLAQPMQVQFSIPRLAACLFVAPTLKRAAR